MRTTSDVYRELKEIRYYYARQKDFDKASAAVGGSRIVELVNMYNKAIRKAPVKLYDLYVALYVNNNTQVVVSYDWNCTPENVKYLHSKLCKFLQKELNISNEEGGDKDDK